MGDVTALYHLSEELKIPETIDKHSIKGGGLPAGPQLVLLAINHAIHPVSLNSFSTWYKETALPQLVGIPKEKLNVENLTSAMDGICREIEGSDGDIRVVDKTQEICAGLTKVWSQRYGIKLDALYYDITSTYFEGVKCILAKLGYNRDGKKGKGQINIALVVTKKESFPLFFRVYEGNVSDQNTIKNVLQDLKSFGITRCEIIWDRGMVSKSNVRKVDRCSQDVICGLKKGDKNVRDILLSVKNEELIREENKVRDLDNGHGIYALAEVRKLYGKRRNIVVYVNTELQESSRIKRERKLRCARARLGAYKSKLERGNYMKISPVVSHVKECLHGVSKYFRPEYHHDKETGKITIDWKVKKKVLDESAELDGKFVLMSTNLGTKCGEIVDAYFGKDKIERAFRCVKDVIKIQPLRCWLSNRVKVHVFICFLAYLLIRAMEYKLQRAGMKITAERAIQELGKIRQGVIIDPTTQYQTIKVARLSKIQKQIIRSLGLSEYIKSES
jgi:transposase